MQVDLKEIHYLKSTKAKRKLGVKMSDRNDFKKPRRLSPELADIVGKTEVIFMFKYFISLKSRYS